jgi:hypothetical protein
MGILPAAPYPTVGQVMNRARALVNDAYQMGAGRILTNKAPFTVEYLNSALEEVQERIRNNGVITLTRDNVLVGPLPPLAASDPTQQTSLAYTGYYVNGAWLADPKLPSDLVAIERVWEQTTGSGVPFSPLHQPMEGLPSVYQGPFLRMFEYRGDALWFPGALTLITLRLRYTAVLPMIGPDQINAQTGDESWATTSINILSSTNTLAQLVAARYVEARAPGSPGATTAATNGEKYMRLILNKYTRMKQRTRYNRRAYGDTQNQNSRTTNNLPY